MPAPYETGGNAGLVARCSSALPMYLSLTTVALLGVLAVACAPAQNELQNPRDSLRTSLRVAEAALAAGQPTVAHRLYLSLAERFDGAPEPVLGLAYIAFLADNFAAAERNYARAKELAVDAPAINAEALLGAGRTALAKGDTDAARQYFRSGNEFGPELPSSAWIANGLAVSETLDGDYDAAEAHYVEALRRSFEHPRIAANLVRMLIAAGHIDDAVRMHAERGSGYWTDDDGRLLARLIETARWDDPDRAAASRRPPAASVVPGFGSRLALRLLLTDATPSAGEFLHVDLPNPSSLVLRLAGGIDPSEPPAAIELPETPALSPAASSGSGHTHATPIAAAREFSSSDPLTLAVGQSRRLRLDGDATSVLVATPEIADVQLLSPNLLYVIGKAIGRTSVAVLGEGGRVHEQVVSVVPDLEPVRAILAGEPDLRGVRPEHTLRGIILTGEVTAAAAADRALRFALAAVPEGMVVENELRIVDSQQVNLEVQIAEVQRSVAEDLGINWEAFQTRGGSGFGFRVGRALARAAIGEAGVGDFPSTTVDGQVAPSAFFDRISGRGRIAGMIDALASAGLANVLARPNLTAMSGKPAAFFSGGEYPLPTGFEDGVIIFEYKKYGILLDFVATVIDAGRITLTVRPEVSEPSLNQSVRIVGIDVPVINVRRAETTVEVGDGESIVIAGLFRKTSNTVESGVPWLKDVLGVGVLFRSTSIRSSELELIIVVTPRLVRPSPPHDDANASPTTRRVEGYHY